MRQTNKILIIGISARAMAESAARSGYEVAALDAFGDRDLQSAVESHSLKRDFNAGYSAQAIYRASRHLTFDAISYASNFENHPRIISRYARKSRIIGNSPETLASARDWKTVFQRVRQAGFCAPETIMPGEREKIDFRKRWLIKPMLSGGGHGIDFYRSSRTLGKESMLQEFIPGKSCSAAFVADGQNARIIGITEQLVGHSEFGARGFQYCGNILPLPELMDQRSRRKIIDQVELLASFLTKAHGLSGVNGIDFILNRDEVWLTEINPRYSASMELMERAYRFPIFHFHAQSIIERKLPDVRLEDFLGEEIFWGKTMLRAMNDCRAPDTRNWLSKEVHDVPYPEEIFRRGSPICTMLVHRPKPKALSAAMLERAGEIYAEMHY